MKFVVGEILKKSIGYLEFLAEKLINHVITWIKRREMKRFVQIEIIPVPSMATDLHVFIVLLPVHSLSNAGSHLGMGTSMGSRDDILKAIS